MLCPVCKGSKKLPIFNKNMSIIACESCKATGKIDNHYPIWKPIGEALSKARNERNETLKDFCKRTGEKCVVRSRMERGLVEPIDKYKEL